MMRATVSATPFRPLRYADVPDVPTRPHRFFAATRRDITVESPGLPPTRIAVHEYGQGPPLLLVHGLMTTGYSFRYLLDLLGDRYRLVMPDLPGAGQSDHPDVYMGPDVLARSLIAILDALGMRGAPVIGNSMGGYLCMRAALLDGAAMGRLVNLHSPGVPTLRMRAPKRGSSKATTGLIISGGIPASRVTLAMTARAKGNNNRGHSIISTALMLS